MIWEENVFLFGAEIVMIAGVLVLWVESNSYVIYINFNFKKKILFYNVHDCLVRWSIVHSYSVYDIVIFWVSNKPFALLS